MLPWAWGCSYLFRESDICISNMCPGNVNATDPGSTFWEPLVSRKFNQCVLKSPETLQTSRLSLFLSSHLIFCLPHQPALAVPDLNPETKLSPFWWLTWPAYFGGPWGQLEQVFFFLPEQYNHSFIQLLVLIVLWLQVVWEDHLRWCLQEMCLMEGAFSKLVSLHPSLTH